MLMGVNAVWVWLFSMLVGMNFMVLGEGPDTILGGNRGFGLSGGCVPTDVPMSLLQVQQR